jgi:hypothetical protein
VVASSPNATLSAIVSENRNGSCGTKPIAPRNVASGIRRTSTPSRNTVPGGGSCSRASKLISVDFPDPVGPTIATVCPAAIRAETCCRTRVSPYENVRSRNSISPLTVELAAELVEFAEMNSSLDREIEELCVFCVLGG